MSGVHASAVIGRHVELGRDVDIGPFVVIEDGVRVGDGTSIAAHAVIKTGVRLGARNRIAEHVVLGGAPQHLTRDGHGSAVEIGDDNVLREGVTIHRGSVDGGVTRVGDGNMLMAYSHVGHDCAVGNRTVIVNGALLGGHVVVEDQAIVSGGVGVHQFCRIGRLAMVGGLTKVTQDCLPFVITDGNPARACRANAIGLRRAGFGEPEIDAIERALRALRATDRLRAEVLSELRRDASQHIVAMCEFVEASTRGVTIRGGSTLPGEG